jgi:magnesium transporter
MSDILPVDFIDEVLRTIKHQDFNKLNEMIKLPHAPDVAELMESLTNEECLQLFRNVKPKISASVFSYLTTNKQITILGQINKEEKKRLLSSLSPDDRVSILNRLPSDIQASLFKLMSKDDLEITNAILKYPRSYIGRIMTTNFVSIKSSWTVEQAIKFIREKDESSDSIDIVYVVDDKGKLVDDIPLSRLIVSNLSSKIIEIMDNFYISLFVYDNAIKGIETIKKYDVNVIPVVDKEGILVGIVTVDDLIDFYEKEETEDFLKIGAIQFEDIRKKNFKLDIKEASLGLLYKSRVTWLSSLIIVGIFSGISVGIFENTIAQTLALIFFLPLTIDSGGNAGSQSATLMVRALATGGVKMSDWAHMIIKELLVSFALGITLGAIVSIIGILRGGIIIALIIGVSMVLIVIVGSTIGVCLPFILTKLGADPATSSGPLITSIADIFGILIYFSVATLILGM